VRRTATLAFARREFESLFRDGAATGLTDRELLARFANCRDHTGDLAFSTLVARHGPMVWSVCRRMLGNAADAEDAFQATFLVLVRRAGALRVAASLGPWLHGVSVRVARRGRKAGLRRAFVELDDAIADTRAEPGRNPDWDLRCAIDEALARLPANYRAVIVLCHLEGLTHEEAAGRLRCPVGTVRSRLARGRALLRDRLERPGLAPANLLALPPLCWEPGSTEAHVPAHLIDITARTAGSLAKGRPLGEIVPAKVGQLVIGVTKTMTTSRLSVAGVLLMFGGLAGWGAAGLAAKAGDPAPRAPAPAAGAALLNAPAAGATEPADAHPDAAAEGQDAAAQAEPAVPDDLPPVVVNIEPKVGAIDVDPALGEIRVTFSKKMMDRSWSWTEGNVYAVPKSNGKIHYEADHRTCVMPVKLEPGKTYVLGINSERFRNFKDSRGRPALPYLVVFRTRDAR
jgi:RNA polymerase sigma factor (sigma-70 family)